MLRGALVENATMDIVVEAMSRIGFFFRGGERTLPTLLITSYP